uniref:COMM domain-containing protein n=1 Tax=Syphacia muris TaxID=451379 RepID=A0A0N5AST8_9BILA
MSTVACEVNPRAESVQVTISKDGLDTMAASDQKQFEKLVQRLEAATIRLEALSSQKPVIAPKPGVGAGVASANATGAGEIFVFMK